jgi:hypothetical protein
MNRKTKNDGQLLPFLYLFVHEEDPSGGFFYLPPAQTQLAGQSNQYLTQLFQQPGRCSYPGNPMPFSVFVRVTSVSLSNKHAKNRTLTQKVISTRSNLIKFRCPRSMILNEILNKGKKDYSRIYLEIRTRNSKRQSYVHTNCLIRS